METEHNLSFYQYVWVCQSIAEYYQSIADSKVRGRKKEGMIHIHDKPDLKPPHHKAHGMSPNSPMSFLKIISQ